MPVIGQGYHDIPATAEVMKQQMVQFLNNSVTNLIQSHNCVGVLQRLAISVSSIVEWDDIVQVYDEDGFGHLLPKRFIRHTVTIAETSGEDPTPLFALHLHVRGSGIMLLGIWHSPDQIVVFDLENMRGVSQPPNLADAFRERGQREADVPREPLPEDPDVVQMAFESHAREAPTQHQMEIMRKTICQIMQFEAQMFPAHCRLRLAFQIV
jgi:hypothetical protein